MVGMQKYIGRVVIMIYLDSQGRISKRTVEVRSVRNGVVRTHCFRAQGPRTFALDRILAVEPAARRAV